MIENGINPEALAVSVSPMLYPNPLATIQSDPILSSWHVSCHPMLTDTLRQNVVKELRKQGQEAQLETAAAAATAAVPARRR